MATGGHDVLVNLQQVKAEDEDAAEEEQEEEEEEEESWEKALSVERFRDIIGDSASCGAERMGRLYTEKDFEYHRHAFLHTHHPLSTHLPALQRKRPHGADRRHKKKRKRKKTSLPPSDVTPTIQEVDEEEAESDADARLATATPTEFPDIRPQFSFGSQEDLEEPLRLAAVHVENEKRSASRKTALTLIREAANNDRTEEKDGGQAASRGFAVPFKPEQKLQFEKFTISFPPYLMFVYFHLCFYCF